ncbi:MAG: DsbA family protein [Anaerolineaceae bacterium]|jgi:protein-disulfide isomerase|nr:MAG: DsbA family protein [Anaerolineaceae bacterium]
MSGKEMSKRQIRREQIKRKETRSRIMAIGLISVGALFLAFLFIYPALKPVGAVAEAPAVNRTNVDFNTVGNPDAPIMIEEYSDFQCPYCRIFFTNTEEQLLESYIADGTVYFIYKSFGAFIGVESGDAAQAAYCAGDQGKFWEMHDIIFANQTGENVGAYTSRRLTAFAETLGLNMDEFSSCFNSGKYKDRIDQDAKDGIAAGIQATPSFVMTYTVDGETRTRIIQGAQSFEAFQQEIEAALAEMGQ